MSDFRPDIWRLQAQFNTQGLVNALKNPDANIRRRAAVALRALGDFAVIPALKDALEAENDPEVRANILAALDALQEGEKRRETGISDTDTSEHRAAETAEIDRYLAQLTEQDPEKVIEAAKKLGEMGDRLAVEPLVVLFNDPKTSIKVRLAVAEALVKLESAPVEVALLAALRNPVWRIRRNAAAILGQLRAQWAVEPLAKALTDENEIVRRTAHAALRHIGTPEALNALVAAHEAEQKQTPTQPEPPAATETSPSATPAEEEQVTPAAEAEQTEEPQSQEEKPKIEWPKLRKTPLDPRAAQTRPLDPQTLERLKQQMKQNKQQDSDDES